MKEKIADDNFGSADMKKILFLFAAVISFTCCQGTTPAIRDDTGQVVEGSIAILEEIELDGIRQTICIRGESGDNPVLLVLHGGPGSSEMFLVNRYNCELEKEFIVVNWDQRGSGKSYHSGIPEETMNVRQFLSDTEELVAYLKEKFSKKKIFLLGHSWGTLLGVLYASENPDSLYAYIGVGQISDMAESERLSWQFVLSESRRENRKGYLKELESMTGPAPYWDPENCPDWFDRLARQREILLKLGGSVYGRTNYNEWINAALKSKEYNLTDIINYFRGEIFSVRQMWAEVMTYNLMKQVDRLEVPVYLMSGRYDHQVSSVLSYRYYENLSAPFKKFIWFDFSGHSPLFEEPDKFNSILVNDIRAAWYGD